MPSVDNQTTAVDLPDRILDRVDAGLPRTEWESSAEYNTVVLEEVLDGVETETEDDFQAVDEGEMQDRLKSLGYLNE